MSRAFIGFPFPTTGGPSPGRTMPDRLADVLNVRDFGAVGNFGGNDAPAIQAAINAAPNGGTIFFPPGAYNTTGRITVSGSSSRALTLMGCGSYTDAGKGSFIVGSFADYLLYVGHDPNFTAGAPGTGTPPINTPIRAIYGLGFRNNFAGADITSTEPTPDGDGRGCVYLGSGICPIISYSEIVAPQGVGLFSVAQNLYLTNTILSGGYNNTSGQTTNRSFGAIFTSGKIANLKVQSQGHGLVCVGDPAVYPWNGGSCIIENIDCEVSGNGFRLGGIPIAWWYAGPKAAGLWPVGFGNVTDIGMESVITNYWLDDVTNVTFQGFNLACLAQIGTGINGILCNNVKRCAFLNGGASGDFSVAALNLNGGGKVMGNLFQNIIPSIRSGPGAVFINRTSYVSGDDPNLFMNCLLDSGMTLAQLPPAPTNPAGPVVCTDSVDPAWDPSSGGKSNVGKPITGGGTNRVFARWNTVSSSWIIAG